MSGKHVAVYKEKERALSPRSSGYPLFSLQREMNRVFDNFFRGMDLWPFAQSEKELETFDPGVDVIETEHEIRVKTELPGMDENDVHVSLSDRTLTIKGEKKEETEDKGKNYYQMERRWGSFYRSVPLPTAIDTAKADAAFKKGVLTVTLPKSVEAKKGEKEIPVHA
ncbi:MAG: hypothetical protein A2992_06870 [Elusimicrobia bacterium RIFCSPLOWO2_01_FULL_59_12]|nr:MAG: hypothetical protein A2992_06870 [Elusimicrobia bacterium RIFCSPLOWO2_01_FULL_59_12]